MAREQGAILAYVTDYTSLLTGSYWNGIEVAGQPAFVTYSFDATAPASDAGHLSASAYATFRPFTAAEQSQAQTALSEWSANSGVVFLQVAAGKGDINFAAYDFSTDNTYKNAGGIGFYPWGNWNYSTYPHFSEDQAGAGNILMNTAFETGGQFAYPTVLHEIGHALGLKEPDQAWTDYGTNPPTVHNVWDPSQPLPSSVMNEGGTGLTHLTAFDIQGIDSVYGIAAQQGSQDASWSWDPISQTLTQTMSNAATDFTRGISTNNVIACGTGTDIAAAIGAGTNTITAGSGSDTLTAPAPTASSAAAAPIP
jgi:serralysin